MLAWILGLPSTWLMGHWAAHDEVVTRWFSRRFMPETPIDFWTKWSGETLIQMTHILPGALWAFVAPFQLHPGFRNRYHRLHRYFGYAFLITTWLMAIGFFVAMHKGLFYEHSLAFVDLPPRKTLVKDVFLINFFMVASVFTISLAAVEARRKKFRVHRRYVIRHIGCSLWVAIQRIMVMTNLGGYYQSPLTRFQQREVFSNGGAIGLLLTIGGGELAIYLLEVEEAKRQIQRQQQLKLTR